MYDLFTTNDIKHTLTSAIGSKIYFQKNEHFRDASSTERFTLLFQNGDFTIKTTETSSEMSHSPRKQKRKNLPSPAKNTPNRLKSPTSPNKKVKPQPIPIDNMIIADKTCGQHILPQPSYTPLFHSGNEDREEVYRLRQVLLQECSLSRRLKDEIVQYKNKLEQLEESLQFSDTMLLSVRAEYERDLEFQKQMTQLIQNRFDQILEENCQLKRRIEQILLEKNLINLHNSTLTIQIANLSHKQSDLHYTKFQNAHLISQITEATNQLTQIHSSFVLKHGHSYKDSVYELLANLQVHHHISANNAGAVLVRCLSHVYPVTDWPSAETAKRSLMAKYVASDFVLARKMEESSSLYIGIDGTTSGARYLRAIVIGGLTEQKNDRSEQPGAIKYNASDGNQYELWETVLEFEECVSHTAESAVHSVRQCFERIKLYQKQLGIKEVTLDRIESIVYDNASENTGRHGGIGELLEKERQIDNPNCTP